jgi:hyperosmotically inducible protein
MRHIKFLCLLMLVGLAGWPAFAGTQGSEAGTTASLEDRINRARVLDHGQVQATYEHGVATLTGTVDNLGSKLDAQRAARKVEGVKQVVNNIQVRADDVTPRQILEQARRQIVTYYGYGIFDNVVLQAEGDKLFVSGQVTQPLKKRDIGNILVRVRGVTVLENDLEVLPNSFFDDRLRLAVARAIYADPFFVHYAMQALPPVHIIVKNGDVTLEGVVATPLDRTKAEMAARLAGTSFSVTNNLRVEPS